LRNGAARLDASNQISFGRSLKFNRNRGLAIDTRPLQVLQCHCRQSQAAQGEDFVWA
jgi:hypothetical protein